MRILHILDHSLPLHSGYCFRTRAIMKAQIEAGLEVAAVTGVRHQQNLGVEAKDVAAQESFDDLTFYRTMEPATGVSPLRELREIALLADRVGEVIAAFKPDILHAHSPALNGLAAQRAARQGGLPLLYEIRAFWEDAAVGNGTGSERSARYWLTRQLENHVVTNADAVAVICEGLKVDLLSRGVADDEKVMISPNGVDMQLFGEPIARDDALAKNIGLKDGPVIGFIGSFYDYEGLDDLVAAMPFLVERHPGAQLLMVGGGPMADALRHQSQQSSVADSIHFVGRVPHEEVEKYYSLIDILAYPRKSMRLTDLVTPLKPLEAMAQQRLVAASNVGGHCELIEDGVTGTLFAPDSPEDCARALADMLDNPEQWPERRATAQRYVAEKRNWQRNIERYLPVYQNLLNPKSDMSMNQAA
ncbi:TIGR04063 family PEP-CTERM/XrtA system glycosyltransferase [Parasphingorhabdus sp. DH2-15]|uniref:TIGR04063 family PEP-CTERM/XrtA system glycosyltransferase n=1 Tax=Parasphingorhabdus sp. DH2-15 TaxID=3444112 RepID=UPI003F685631